MKIAIFPLQMLAAEEGIHKQASPLKGRVSVGSNVLCLKVFPHRILRNSVHLHKKENDCLVQIGGW